MDAGLATEGRSPDASTLIGAPEDSVFYARYLTERQIMYATLRLSEPNWKSAAKRAGYSESTSQADIESGPMMSQYMRLVAEEASMALAISAEGNLAAVARLTLSAEKKGEIGTALSGRKIINEMRGYNKPGEGANLGTGGVVINIVSPAPIQTGSRPALSETNRAILMANGMGNLLEAGNGEE